MIGNVVEIILNFQKIDNIISTRRLLNFIGYKQKRNNKVILKWIGVGGAATLPEMNETGDVDLNECLFHTSATLEDENGDILLIDCGSDSRFALAKAGIMPKDYGRIKGLYISHQHADHIGGMEILGFCTLFNPNIERPTLFCNTDLMHDLWKHSLSGGLSSIQTTEATLTTYFDCHALDPNEGFTWGDANITPVQTVHVVSGFSIKYSYGLLITTNKQKTFITTDTQYAPNQIKDFYNMSDMIFQDCETSPFPSGVHAHYSDLSKLEQKFRNKMWMVHYQKPADIGCAGFVNRGQEFDI